MLDPSVAHPAAPASDPSLLAPVLGARKDGSAAAESGRDLLMTALGEFVLPNGGQAWTQTLLHLLGRLGMRDKAARQALARMEERGWLHRERVGRRTRWTLTDDCRALLEAGAERIYGFGRSAKPWDGTWVVLLASVPERERRVRLRMATGLSWAGFGSIGPGIWLSPWRDDETSATRLLRDLDVSATSFRATLGEIGSGPDLVAQAWDLPSLRAQYAQFLADSDELTEPPDDPQSAAVTLIRLVHRWRRFPFLDPDLPAELLPADWPGPDAARRFGTLRTTLSPPAQSWWRATDGRFVGDAAT